MTVHDRWNTHDYAGQTVPIKDRHTGASRAAQIFVAVLGFSNYTHAEATASQSAGDWLGAHVRALQYFGGAPRAVVPDFVAGNKIGLMCPSPLCVRTVSGDGIAREALGLVGT